MASTDAEMYDSDSSDVLGDALGTEALDLRPMVPSDYAESPWREIQPTVGTGKRLAVRQG